MEEYLIKCLLGRFRVGFLKSIPCLIIYTTGLESLDAVNRYISGNKEYTSLVGDILAQCCYLGNKIPTYITKPDKHANLLPGSLYPYINIAIRKSDEKSLLKYINEDDEIPCNKNAKYPQLYLLDSNDNILDHRYDQSDKWNVLANMCKSIALTRCCNES